jgi:hypothetical protein
MNDFQKHLSRQLRFLENSCKLYDQGEPEEAIRIAVSLRVLFHDTHRCTSLLSHLGQKQSWILSTAEFFATPQLMEVPLVHINIQANPYPTGRCACIASPMLDKSARNENVHTKTWWAEEKIIKCGSGSEFSRRDLVLNATDKDGGAHVDKNLDDVYTQILGGAGLSIDIVYKGGQRVSVRFEHLHFASLRQMAYEVLNSKDIQRLRPTSDGKV